MNTPTLEHPADAVFYAVYCAGPPDFRWQSAARLIGFIGIVIAAFGLVDVLATRNFVGVWVGAGLCSVAGVGYLLNLFVGDVFAPVDPDSLKQVLERIDRAADAAASAIFREELAKASPDPDRAIRFVDLRKARKATLPRLPKPPTAREREQAARAVREAEDAAMVREQRALLSSRPGELP